MDEITKHEQEYINGIQAEMIFYDQYLDFMKRVKKQYVEYGPEQAIRYVQSYAADLVGIAADELFSALFNKL